jgi:hypothetical protein
MFAAVDMAIQPNETPLTDFFRLILKIAGKLQMANMKEPA